MEQLEDEREITNADRVEWASKALTYYSATKEGPGALYDDVNTVAIDLLTDLLHLLRQEGINPFQSLETARTYFLTEDDSSNDSLYCIFTTLLNDFRQASAELATVENTGKTAHPNFFERRDDAAVALSNYISSIV